MGKGKGTCMVGRLWHFTWNHKNTDFKWTVIIRSTARRIIQKDRARKDRDKFKNEIPEVQIVCFRKIGKGETRKQ